MTVRPPCENIFIFYTAFFEKNRKEMYMPMMRINKQKKLGEILVSSGKLTEEELQAALNRQKGSGKKLGELLIEEKRLTENEILKVLEMQLGIQKIDLNEYFVDPQVPILIQEKIARRHTLIPVKRVEKKLFVAMNDPLNMLAIDDIRLITGLEPQPILANKADILTAINTYYGKELAKSAIADFRRQNKDDDDEKAELDSEIAINLSNAPVVRLVNTIIKQAVSQGASDIHIEPFENILRIRFRIDGDLVEIMDSDKNTHPAILTRIKIMASLDIAEKRIPQDGRIELSVEGKDVDLRISTLPTVFGEKIVIRILDRTAFLVDRSELGFSEENEKLYDKVIKNPSGIILITGPTGSGKTTTLYTILREINDSRKNIITVEDPVEYRLYGINQVQVNNKAGLTFANGLRSILRQDPDIVMIGEMRDKETTEIAIRASITGHLVISTMHTNSAPSTISRLMDMGIEPYLISSSLVGVISQRLIKKICEKCKEPIEPTYMQARDLGIDRGMIYIGKGCNHCKGTGYRGRRGIHEILTITKQIRELLDRGVKIDIVTAAAKKEGMRTLRETCRELVLSGETSYEEYLRVTYEND